MTYKRVFGSDPEGLRRLAALGMGGEQSEASPSIESTVSMDVFSERPGDWVGEYKLISLLGEGGMGIVYLAEQSKPIKRRVALKLIKPGMDSKRVLARFEAEQQALALMDHPNIASVYDAGLTASSRPYFVMEYVRGTPITDYCDKARLTVPERLSVFLDVCRAVQHAHHKGIIHRDIKPSNILVAAEDGRAVAKVIDFGVARAISQPLTDQTLCTSDGQLIGTPEYMSPEQADLNNQDIDTRTDIYSLGIVLYQLLSGVLPFDPGTLREGGLNQIRKIICEEQPKTPSTRLSTVDGEKLAKLADLRRTDIRSLQRELKGDMDWITVKALEKDRNRRYGTATALAEDIERHLKSEPVSAVPPSTIYRLQRYVRRNRLQVIAGSCAIAFLFVSIMIMAMWSNHRKSLKAVEATLHQSKLVKAKEHLMKREFTEATALIRPLLDSDYVRAEAQLLYATLLVEGRHTDKAISELGDLLTKEPQLSAVAHSLLSRVYWESGLADDEKVAKAKYHRNQAEALMPGTAEAFFLRALTATTVAQIRELVSKALELDPSHYESHKLLALVNNASRRYGQLRESSQIMIALRPKEALGYSLRSSAWMGLKEYIKAAEDCNTALKLIVEEDEEAGDLAYQRSYALLMAQDYHQVQQELGSFENGPDEIETQFACFCAYTGLGRYAAAKTVYRHIAEQGPDSVEKFKELAKKYVFDKISEDQLWHPEDDEPSGVAYLAMLDAERDYYVFAKHGKRLLRNAFTPAWAPDGERLAFSLGSHGHSGLAVLELKTGEITLLITPGKEPSWAPDGKSLAFVRDRKILPLSDFMKSKNEYKPLSVTEEEVWIIKSDGSEPRRICKGSRPSWSPDGNHIYYYSRTDLKQYLIALDNTQAEPVPVMDYYGCTQCFPSVSPNGNYVAYVQDDTVRLVRLSDDEIVSQWAGPPGIWVSQWDQDSKRIWLAGGQSPQSRTGLWAYDMTAQSGLRVLTGPVSHAASNPKTPQMLFCLGQPVYEIWISDTKVPASEHVDLEQHCREMTTYYTELTQADPCDFRSKYLLDEYKSRLGKDAADSVAEPASLPFELGEVENLGPPINTRSNEGTPHVTRDGRFLYFTSDRPNGYGASDLWMAEWDPAHDNWSQPENLGETVNGPGHDYWPWVSNDGLTLFFYSEREGGHGNGDLWVTTRPTPDSKWTEPVSLDAPVNSASLDAAPCLSDNGLELFFTSMRDGRPDLWVSKRSNVGDQWLQAENLGSAVNSLKIDACPNLSSDGLQLFFNSTRNGNQDLYWTTRESKHEKWASPVNLGPKVNTEVPETCPCLSPDGKYLYFCECMGKSYRPGGHGGTDIWRVPILQRTGQ